MSAFLNEHQVPPGVPAWEPSAVYEQLPEMKESWVPGMVVAGGALVSWAFPDVPLRADADVDLWTFERATFLATLARFDTPDNTFFYAQRNVKIVRPGGLLPVQLMYYPHNTMEALVADFDMDAVRVFTDGTHRWLHVSCVPSWQQRAVLSCNKPRLPLYRALKMMAKGFRVQLSFSDVDFVQTQPSKQPVAPELAVGEAVRARGLLLARLVESLDADAPWTGYYGKGQVMRPSRDVVFETVVALMVRDTRVGVTTVPPDLAMLLDDETSKLYFFESEESMADLPIPSRVRLTVRVYGAVPQHPQLSHQIVAWQLVAAGTH